MNGAVGAAWFQDGEPAIVFVFTVDDEKITEIELIANPQPNIVPLAGASR